MRTTFHAISGLGAGRAALRAAAWTLMVAGLAPAHAARVDQPDAAPAPSQDPPPATAPPESADPVARALATLLDDGAPEALRLDAARVLAGAAGTDQGRRAITGILGDRSGNQDPSGLLLRALAREPTLPADLLGVLTDLAGSLDGERLHRVLAAAGAIRTPEALRLVARFLDPAIPAAARNAAQASLVRATGREDLASTPQAWLEWIDRTEQGEALGGPEWSRVLARGIAERADRLAARSRELAARLVESQRRLYVLTPADQRGAALAAMITDDNADVRAVGFELLEREMVTSPTPPAEVIGALLGLLSHAQPAVRGQAAVFVGRIAPEGAGEAVATALTFEQDPAAAGAMLAAAARWPTDQIREPVLLWLENGPVNRAVAANTAMAMLRAGSWAPPDIQRIGDAMRGVPQAELSPQGCRLIASVGTDADRRSLAGLLLAGSALQRLAVADALAERPEFLDAVIAAAARDPSLIPAAARSVAIHRPTIEGYRAIAALDCPDEQVRRAALRTVGEALSTGALLSAADETGSDAASTQWLLERARAQAQDMVVAGDPAGDALLSEAAERLARLHLELARPAEALAALDAVPSGPTDSRFNPLRTVALVVLGRIEEAEALQADAAIWLEALERAIALPHATRVVEVILERFGSTLTPAQTERLAGLRARLPRPTDAPDPG